MRAGARGEVFKPDSDLIAALKAAVIAMPQCPRATVAVKGQVTSELSLLPLSL